ncbi:zinc-dependent alcohol dehydrogenase family protein [Limosilactobacillus albertensis]|uniref:Probable alcohol dehydrogenase AdhA n=1 Tax=Limosilactobacillus albertensis TaxID=2759752 RepID=A0A839GZ72_9LACO|nr:zinc-dependent alcohol dehydrogenase family protein [Limosilactobacillus albertensis]MBB1123665.1 zinc-dependent alcohol dehydrogenase family protein [Limosilactobacillus albertensis]MCD7121537.1 zinc-dependent alcohol dehydrogenase family protein [Limosilactobacillus albertensis]
MEKREDAIPKTMKAWAVTKPGPIDGKESPIKFIEKPVPTPNRGEVLVKVLTCGVCHTDLHVTEGDLPVHQPNVTPGHEIVGKVVGFGPETQRFKLGERIGIPWFRHACGVCKFCRSGHENLCPHSVYTGWDHDGGYAEYVTVPEGFAYRLPEKFNSLEAAPLLCAGIIGYRAFERANIPAGGRLGLYGFGGSAHITAQIALAQGIEVHVFTRGEDAKKFALELGCSSVQGSYDPSPVPLDSSIIFAPVGDMVLPALASLVPGGTLALAGIHMTDIPAMNYQKEIFHEKTLTSVESNTRRDGEEFLTLADRLNIHPEVHEYPLAKADEALRYVKNGDIKGACVLRVSED